MTDPDPEAFTSALNDLQREYGVYVDWHPWGFRLTNAETGEYVGWLLDTLDDGPLPYRYIPEDWDDDLP
jgi:hypothetical protein